MKPEKTKLTTKLKMKKEAYKTKCKNSKWGLRRLNFHRVRIFLDGTWKIKVKAGVSWMIKSN